MSYGIEVGQIYLAADGGEYGHLVTDVTTHARCDDVVVRAFTRQGFDPNERRIDSFKLAIVRYYLVEGDLPNWIPATENIK